MKHLVYPCPAFLSLLSVFVREERGSFVNPKTRRKVAATTVAASRADTLPRSFRPAKWPWMKRPGEREIHRLWW